ncbi:hypothetical protein ACFWY9_23045 [Amycolatopsis sp. NPDC059027]|uniref:hypothetical protein n=1 Tax=Amycolatopsis sp. NPDC059027 TaxID=3346709 RepID=UPI0036732D1E
MAEQPPTYDPNGNIRWFEPEAPPPGGSYGGKPANSWVTDLTGDTPGFQYDEATLHSLVADWKGLADEFQEDASTARRLGDVVGPGKEYASAGHADRIHTSGEALAVTFEQRQKYCRDMADKYIAALGKYATAEETGKSDVRQAGGGIL